MAILRVKSLVATAEIAGLVREVGYDCETKRLWVEALNADEAMELLKQMGRASKQLTQGTTANETAVVEGLAGQTEDPPPAKEPAKTETKAKPVRKSEPKKEPAKKRSAPKKAAEEPEPPAAEEPAPEPEAKAEAKPARKPVKSATVQDDIEAKEEAPEEPEPSPKAETSSGNGISQELLGAKKLRDIVSILYDEGFKTPEDMVARCQEIAPKLPVIKRIKNLDERITRAMEVMDML
jgi:outer membrane biosynthesis protein TonB